MPLGGVQENGRLGVVGRGASCFPQILEAARESSGHSQEVWQEDMPKGLHGWVEQKQPLERSFPFSQDHTLGAPSGRSAEQGGWVSPTLSKGGLSKTLRSHGSTILLERGLGDARVCAPSLLCEVVAHSPSCKSNGRESLA